MFVHNAKYYYKGRFYFLVENYKNSLSKPSRTILRDETGKILHDVVCKKEKEEIKIFFNDFEKILKDGKLIK